MFSLSCVQNFTFPSTTKALHFSLKKIVQIFFFAVHFHSLPLFYVLFYIKIYILIFFHFSSLPPFYSKNRLLIDLPFITTINRPNYVLIEISISIVTEQCSSWCNCRTIVRTCRIKYDNRMICQIKLISFRAHLTD